MKRSKYKPTYYCNACGNISSKQVCEKCGSTATVPTERIWDELD